MAGAAVSVFEVGQRVAVTGSQLYADEPYSGVLKDHYGHIVGIERSRRGPLVWVSITGAVGDMSILTKYAECWPFWAEELTHVD